MAHPHRQPHRQHHEHDHEHDEVRLVHSPHVPDHDHDHDEDPGRIEDNPIWQQDNVTLHSVGVDIGSSGTQVLFSRLFLRRIGEELTSRYLVVRRETLHRSPVWLTPYASETMIDAGALGALVDEAYDAADVDPRDVDTGVVILTGEALRRRNAAAIASVLAAKGGDLVTATAGHHMEARLAAYGSGAVRGSYEAGTRVLTVDIGGGTTKLALVDHGRVVATAAVHIGGRLQVTGPDGRIERLAPAGRDHARRAGYDWDVGSRVTGDGLDAVAESMAGLLVRAVLAPHEVKDLYLTDPLPGLGRLDGVVFSGGVAEYVYGREHRDFGDLGRRLGARLRELAGDGALGAPLLPAGECIRATAVGASEYSVQLSGNTGHISSPDALLPRRNLPVVRPGHTPGDEVDADALAEAIRRRLREADAEDPDRDVALALTWRGLPSYERLLPFARGVRDGLAARTAAGRPVYVVLDGDVAMTLGRLLTGELGQAGEVLVLDGITLQDFDYVDLGRVRHPSGTVPVTIKSLVFAERPRS
ncbi:ethanolamine ammonia-lyase reactivating factor EutA [Streptomyces tendae]|uniref:ethanolamine ammonia-lyase reactivating factor EutA n=1 Tax=Streptomyces TaxID=1883 RepID=UPI001B365FF1|nr:ethanolamine ammonia-lyase reactivating factor EutA [Streptomyces sp. RK23]MBQ0964948.1 ethanolamine ammonia-lyase reactivating factor EutA [Streptomyces sp. RK74B]MBQ1006178.1 ethanolamine ammonia-lyase reactivating factor EutA [Streptomyces sp. RK23]